MTVMIKKDPDNIETLKKTILPVPDFLNCLRIEKQRADRFKAPLSIVLFSFQEREKGGEALILEFLRYLNRNTREIDIKGWVSRDVLGLLLPDTDANGVKHCVKKIVSGDGNLAYSVVTATYPDHVFESILGGEDRSRDLLCLDIDESFKSHKFQDALKRGMDILGSIVGMLLFSPLMLLTAFAVKVTSPGPAIFKQPRLGLKGSRFSFYKFRSMYIEADDRIHRDYVTDLINGNHEKINQGGKTTPLYKIKTDPRVTKVGKIIRKLSIDELPQFYNVLKGEMSLVGPRPPLPYEVQKYEPWHLRRILEVKPGITGLWQVDGRSRTTFNDMVRLDLRYIQNRSFWLDLAILVKTVRAVIRSNGAV